LANGFRVANRLATSPVFCMPALPSCPQSPPDPEGPVGELRRLRRPGSKEKAKSNDKKVKNLLKLYIGRERHGECHNQPVYQKKLKSS